jgi:hypothetical protein
MSRSGLNSPRMGRRRGLSSAIGTRLSRFSHSSVVLFTLKGFNSALTAISNFVLAYVLVRTIGLESYAVIASLFAVAALVVQSDFGITGATFFKLRSHYLGENRRALHRDRRHSVAILGIALAAGLVQVGPHSVAYLLIFAGAVCALPRMALRAAINARDGFVSTETVDLGRRIALLAVTVAMLLGLSFASNSAISLLMWVLTSSRSSGWPNDESYFFFALRGTSEGPVLLSGCLADGGTRPR